MSKLPRTHIFVLQTLFDREKTFAYVDYVISGQKNDPNSNTWAWATLNKMRDRGLVDITHHPEYGVRIARITQEGRDRYIQYLGEQTDKDNDDTEWHTEV